MFSGVGVAEAAAELRPASAIRIGFSSAIRAGVMRIVGPVMLSAATTSPPAPRTGAAIAASPSSSSSIAVGEPVAPHDLLELGPQPGRDR